MEIDRTHRNLQTNLDRTNTTKAENVELYRTNYDGDIHFTFDNYHNVRILFAVQRGRNYDDCELSLLVSRI